MSGYPPRKALPAGKHRETESELQELRSSFAPSLPVPGGARIRTSPVTGRCRSVTGIARGIPILSGQDGLGSVAPSKIYRRAIPFPLRNEPWDPGHKEESEEARTPCLP